MMEGAARVKWHDFTEAMPAFLVMVTMPLAMSITDGIAFGLIAYAVLKPATGRAHELHPVGYLVAVLLGVRYVF
jgi:AGZA family xanthine/uracil permease-like MFS transporter